MRIGELMRDVPKAAGGDRKSENFKNDSVVDFEKTKSAVIREAGFTPKQVELSTRAQGIAEAVLDAEVRIGELMRDMPKATKGTGANQYKRAENDSGVDFSKTKSAIIREAG